MAPFTELTEAQLDAVIDTQLRGALNVSRPAWAVMAASGGGRFVNVSSGAAFGGVPGGAVYGMAKMGVIGLTLAMASEGKDAGIAANVIAPYAKTRPETGFGPFPPSAELNEWLHPRLVAPLVGWLAHDSCPVTGECFSVGGGHYAKVEPGDRARSRRPRRDHRAHRRGCGRDPRLGAHAGGRRAGFGGDAPDVRGVQAGLSSFSASALSCMIRRCDSRSSSLISTA